MITNHAEGTFESLRYNLGIMFSGQPVLCSALMVG